MNYYNEYDLKAAAGLRELINQGLIPAGDVDTRSIAEIKPHELRNYTQCHFFAGIGGWSLALQLAGWPATRPVWTGSCPCQPFSSAGKQLGDKDERHLWPVFFNLIRECRPEFVFGEQVASAIGKGWLDGVSADLEGAGYACGATVLGAHSVGAPHIRQRLFWVADATSQRREWRQDSAGQAGRLGAESTGGAGHPQQSRLERHSGHEHDGHQPGRIDADAAGPASETGSDSRLADAAGSFPHGGELGLQPVGGRCDGYQGYNEQPAGFWSRFNLIPCADGKARRIEPGLAPMVDGVPRGVVPSGDPRREGYAQNTAEARVMRLKGYGNAIVPQVAAEFVRAFTSPSE